jgi:hypothetical protein
MHLSNWVSAVGSASAAGAGRTAAVHHDPGPELGGDTAVALTGKRRADQDSVDQPQQVVVADRGEVAEDALRELAEGPSETGTSAAPPCGPD